MNLQKRQRKWGVVVLIVAVFAFGLFSCARNRRYAPIQQNEARWRVAYYEGGPWLDYVDYLISIINGLAEKGWIETIDLSSYLHTDDSAALWQYLSDTVESEYIEFVPDAYWSADWEDGLRIENRTAAIARFNQGDIDLVIAAGTWAGLDLAHNLHSVPTLVISTTDPIGAGIIESAEDSGLDHVIARCDPGRFYRQVQLFYNMTDFQHLGVVYEDTVDGRTYASLTDLETAAQKNGFTLHTCVVEDADVSFEETTEQVSVCMQQLAPEIDAFWFSDLRAFSPENFPAILTPLMTHQVKTWSAENTELVPRGVLFAMDYGDLSEIGVWYAEVIAQIFHGVLPREIDQVFQSDGQLVINAETARRIGYDLPESLFKAADEVFQTIEGE